MQARAGPELGGKRVLVVEDEYLIAAELSEALERCGAVVVGPAPDIDRARELVEAGDIACAVLDINLHGEHVFVLARELRTRGLPFVFATGYGATFVPPDLQDAPHFEKPLDFDSFMRAVGRALAA